MRHKRRMRWCLTWLAIWAALHGARAEERHFPHQGVERRVVLHNVGPGRPVVIALHAFSQSVEDLRGAWPMDAVAEREGFAVAYPEAIGLAWSYSAQRPTRFPGTETVVDDLGFIGAVIDRLIERGADAARIHVAGASRGGLMAWTLACALPQRLASAAPMLSGMTDGQIADCPPARPLPLITIAGTADPVQWYDGAIQPSFRLLSVPETIEFWRARHGCSGLRSRELPHRQAGDPTSTRRVEWLGCAAPLHFLRVEGGGHRMPSLAPAEPSPWAGIRGQDFETAEELWRFFRAQTR